MVTLAEVLMQWPLETATAAASPIHGAPKAYKDFPVTAGQLTEWCKDASEALYEEARHERDRNTLRLAGPKTRQPTQAELDALRRKYPQFFPSPGSKASTRRPRHSDNERRDAQAILDRHAAAARREPQEQAAE